MESLDELSDLRLDAEAALHDAGIRWLERRAAGQKTSTIEAEITALEDELRLLDRKIARRRSRRKDKA